MADPKDISKETLANYKEFLKIQEQSVDSLKAELLLEQQKLKILIDENDKANQELVIKQKEIDLGEEELSQEEKILKNKLLEIENAKELGAITKETYDLQLKLREEELKVLEAKKLKLEVEKESIKTLKKAEEHFEKLEGIGESFANKLGLSGNVFKNSLVGQLFEGKSKGFANIGDQLKKIGKGFAEAFEAGNLFASLQKNVVQSTLLLAVSQDNALSSFNRATGAAGKYDDMIIGLESSNRSLGLDSEKIAKAIEGMKHSFLDFNQVGKNTQKELTLMAASFESFGISAETTGKIMTSMTKGMGLTVSQSMQAQKEIFATAKALGVAPSKMAADFAAAAPKLAAFGSKGKDIFRQMAAAAKSASMEVENFLEIGDAVDTFEGSVDVAGQLNGILRGNVIDSVKLMETAATEGGLGVAKMLQSALKAGGQSFDDMSFQMKKSLTKIIPGMKSVDDLGKLMKADFDKESTAAKEAALSQDKMNKMIEDAIPIQDKLKSIMLAFAVGIKPIVDGLGWIMTKISELNDMTGGVFIPVMVGLLGVFVVWGKLLKGSSSLMRGVGAALDLLRKKKIVDTALTVGQTQAEVASNAVGTTTVATAQAKAASTATLVPVMLALGAAILMIGIGVGIAAYGFSKLAESMKGMGAEADALVKIVGILILGFVAIAAGLIVLAIVGSSTVSPLLAVGAALLMIGGGIALAGWGMATFLKVAKDIMPILPQLVLLIGALAVSFLALGLAGLMLSLSMPLLVVGLGALAVSLAIAGSKGLGAIIAIGSMFSVISTLSSTSIGALNNISLGILNIVAAIDKLPTEKTIAFNASMEAISSLPEIKSETVENVKLLVDQVVRYRETNEGAKAGATNNFTQLIAAASSGGEKNRGEKQPIILQLDGRVLKRFVIDTLNETMDPKRV